MRGHPDDTAESRENPTFGGSGGIREEGIPTGPQDPRDQLEEIPQPGDIPKAVGDIPRVPGRHSEDSRKLATAEEARGQKIRLAAPTPKRLVHVLSVVVGEQIYCVWISCKRSSVEIFFYILCS